MINRKEYGRRTAEFFKTELKWNLLSLAATLIAIIFYFATTSMYIWPMNNTYEGLYGILAAITCLPFVLWLINIFFVRKKALSIAVFALGVVLISEHFVLALAAVGYLAYFFIEGWPYIFTAAGIALIVVMYCALYGKRGGKIRAALGSKVSKATLSAAVTAAFIFVAVFSAFNLLPMYFPSGAVVFAVEDEYQIAWSTSVSSVGSVTVGGQSFFDGSGGNLKVSRLHKVSVPMALLNEAKAYSVQSTAVYGARAYLPSSGAKRTATYAFRPVDVSDGLQIYSVSDNHTLTAGVKRAATYFGDKLDILVALGDHLNDVSTEGQIFNMYGVLHAASANGSRPVIFARGNHETRGRLAADFAQYVGSKDGNFYYNVRLGGVRFLVLDLGNDIADDSPLVRPLSDFDRYREQELKWLQTQSADLDAQTIAVCHMPFPKYLGAGKYSDDVILQFIEQTERLETRFLLGAHSHKTLFAEAFADDNPASFPYIVDAKRSNKTDGGDVLSLFAYTGTALQFEHGQWSIAFTNAKHEILKTFSL